jgi:hypothetical protein
MAKTAMRNLAVGLAVAGALVGGHETAGAQGGPKPQASNKTSTAADRRDVGITVYNSNFGLVREVREVDLGAGRGSLEFRDVAAGIQPETVAIRPLGGARLNVLEQNYRYDLLTPQKLLEKYVGRRVRVYRYNERLGKEDAFDADVLSVADGQSVLKINGEITYNFPGRMAFPDVPANLIAKPTLVWLLDSGGAKPTVEVTYLTHGLDWHCDYVFVLNDTDTAGDLTAWVTLANTSGAAYENAKLKLVAGTVQRVEARQQMLAAVSAARAAPAPPQFKEEGFFEYHLYTLNQPTTLLENEQKQVTLLDASGVHVDKRLIFWGQQYWYRSQVGQVMSNQKVGVFLDIQNKESNHLGIALPKGVVRVYKADKSGAKQFIGEDSIDHTPRDERLRIKMGEAFDVVGDRKQTSWNKLGSCVSESEWEITLRNHKDVAEEVEDVEPVGGDWEVISESATHAKKDAFTFTYTVKVPARGETKIRYKVRVRWC